MRLGLEQGEGGALYSVRRGVWGGERRLQSSLRAVGERPSWGTGSGTKCRVLSELSLRWKGGRGGARRRRKSTRRRRAEASRRASSSSWRWATIAGRGPATRAAALFVSCRCRRPTRSGCTALRAPRTTATSARPASTTCTARSRHRPAACTRSTPARAATQ